MGLAFAAVAACELGDVESAASYSEANEAVFQGRPFWLHGELAKWGRAVELVTRGDIDGGRAGLVSSLGEQVRRESGLFARFAAVDLAEVAIDQGDPDAAAFARSSAEALNPTRRPGLGCV